jgi:glutamyl-Q tRNA(Asp) synthetase
MSHPAPSSDAVFRFAPSPNGRLHLGHARSALINRDLAEKSGGRFLLRIEDIDKVRTREEHVKAIEDDLAWLGLSWEQPVLRQSTRFAAYAEALDALEAQGVLYPCFCSRTDILAATKREELHLQKALPRDPDGAPLYPGTCRALPLAVRERRRREEPFCLRLDTQRAFAKCDALHWQQWNPVTGAIVPVPATPLIWGDAVIGRKDVPGSYHLAVVVDDAFQGISHVVRGKDLEQATHLHRLLQALLDIKNPLYHHHDLIIGPDGHKLSKSAGSQSLQSLRKEGNSSASIRALALEQT